MNWIDIVIIATVALCFGLGMISGLIWQVAGIVSLFAGVVATIFLGPMVSQALGRWIQNPTLARMAAYIAVFSLASMGIRILATVFAKMLERFKMKKLDRLLGGAVGILKAILISAVMVIILGRYGTAGSREAVDNSMFGNMVITLVDFVAGKADEYDVTEKARAAWEKGKAAARDLKRRGEGLAGNGDDGDAGNTGETGNTGAARE